MAGSDNPSRDHLLQWPAILSTILGFLTTLLTFVLEARELVHDPAALRIASFATYAVFLAGTAWFASKAGKSWQRRSSLVVLYVGTALYFTWVGTWLIAPAPEPFVIDDMSGASLWNIATDGRSSLFVYGESERTTHVLKLDYAVNNDGWVAIHREISPAALTDARAIGFSFKGSGAPNTIELKLIRKPDNDGRSAVFGVMWNHATATNGWRSVEAPYSLFVCWKETGCLPGEVLNPGEVWKIDIAISNKAGDTPGTGTIWIGPIVGIP
ncbi:MAG: hypothetical protein RMJ55_06525 [Roseiflexaceae bacterium]|nr:hypothetical protein [Roseiflexus sp.]MDW8213191.1 hypothetical protein [Roseiflexaceae bacterium]